MFGLVLAVLLPSLTAHAQTRIPATGFEDLDASVESLLTSYQVPGASIAIARNGRLLTVRGYGSADVDAHESFLPESFSRWNSISKTVTAVGLLQLVEQGKLDLDAHVFDILTDIRPYNGRWGDARIPSITVRQLMHHTGGWDRDLSGDPTYPPLSDRAAAALGVPTPPSAEVMIRYALAAPLDFGPGTRFAYSNLGYLLLGFVLEKASGEPYEAFTRKHVLDPIALTGMLTAKNRLDQRQPGEVRYYDFPQVPLRPSAFLPGNPLTPGPYAIGDIETALPIGGWLGSVVHLARFAESIDGQRPPAALRPETVAKMVAQTDPSIWMNPTTWYGLGIIGMSFPEWEVWTHTGGSIGSRSTFLRVSNGYSWALLLNGEGSVGGDTFRSALAQALTAACQSRRTWPDIDLFPRYLPPHATAVSNAASLQAAPVAPDSLATLWGSELAGAGSEPLSLRMRDSAGAEHTVPLTYTSLTQVNLRIPASVAPGAATLLLQRAPHKEVTFALEIAPVSPGLFAVNQDGLAAGIVTRLGADGSRVEELVTRPIRLPESSEAVYLTLYGTGFRGRSSLAAVDVVFDDRIARAEFAGPQPTIAGLDQVNVKLTRDLIHSGTVRVTLRVDGTVSNTVSLVFE